MKTMTSMIAIGIVITACSFSVQASKGGGAESNPTGPFVECLLPSGQIEFMPVMFCEIKKGKYHY